MYLFHNADGLSTEGIGAIAQYQIHTYTLSKLLGVEFASTDFVNIQHYQGNSTQNKFGEDITNFFNFPNKINLDNLCKRHRPAQTQHPLIHEAQVYKLGSQNLVF